MFYSHERTESGMKARFQCCSLPKSRLSEMIPRKRDNFSPDASWKRTGSEIQRCSMPKSRLSELKSPQARFA